MSREVQYGWKKCRHCGEHVKGPRTLICPHCQGDLSKLAKPGEPERLGKEDRKVVVIPDGYTIPDEFRLTSVHTPAGECPLRFRSAEDGLPSEDEIAQWAMNLRQHMIDAKSAWFRNSALAYWAVRAVNRDNRFHPASPEMKLVRETIAKLPDIEVKVITPTDNTVEIIDNDETASVEDAEDGWY